MLANGLYPLLGQDFVVVVLSDIVSGVQVLPVLVEIERFFFGYL